MDQPVYHCACCRDTGELDEELCPECFALVPAPAPPFTPPVEAGCVSIDPDEDDEPEDTDLYEPAHVIGETPR